ncbi:lipoate-protein ligase A [Desulfofundulus luciae]|uniref:Lipoate-protein ligase A n=1 Tax=Desulfofundulus luciae TaxID=74702 RepID=A0ABU0B4C9_9FIRM|nr:biotin/lipoate A/B protein ligase family protein [Desulfofundulus luciae]MDQ0287566.1 lipoate-protein ligase A [Desulfofundulus luciae]
MFSGETKAAAAAWPRQWRLLETGAGDGATNMAVDEAILVHHSRGEVPPTLRFYRWDPPTLSLGYFQNADREVDREACRRMGIGLVRRPTGGRAVLHDREVTYSVIIAQKFLPGSVLETYRLLSQGLVAGLRLLGVEVDLFSPGKTQRELRSKLSAACFDSPSGYEVAVAGKKLVGSAQVRQRGIILQHGSILLSVDEEKLFTVLAFPSEAVRQRVKAAFGAKATALDRVLPQAPGYDQVCRVVAQGFATALGIDLIPSELTAGERLTARKLALEKYSYLNWHKQGIWEDISL